MSGISMPHSDIKFNAAKAMVCLGGNTLCHRPDMFLPLQKSLRELTSKRGKKKEKKPKKHKELKRKLGKLGKLRLKMREREKSQKGDIDESLEFLEEEENRNRANGNPAIPMRVMACEPLGHGLLHR